MSRAIMVLLAGLGSMAAVQGRAPRSFIGAGSALPAFRLRTVDGKELTSDALRGKAGLVFFARKGQENTARLLREIAALETRLGPESWARVERIAIFSGEADAAAVGKMARDAGFTGTILLDPDRTVYSRFGVIAVPSIAVFDRRSVVTYSRPGFGVGLESALEAELRKVLAEKTPPSPTAGGDGGAQRRSPVLTLARKLMRTGRPEDLVKAEQLLRREIGRAESLDLLLALGDVLLRRKDFKGALEHFRKVARKHPRTFRVEIGLARAVAGLGRGEDAEKILRRIILHVPRSWEAHYALAEVHASSGRKDLAIREYRLAIDLLREKVE